MTSTPGSIAPADESARRPLVILTSVHGARDGDRLVLDIKALEGLFIYQRCWSGPVIWALSLGDKPPGYARAVDPSTLPFAVLEVAEDRSDLAAKLPPDAVVVAAADNYLDLGLSEQLPGQVVYIIEYTLKTRLDILRALDGPWSRKLRTLVWELLTERRRRRAVRRAIGLQCNGLPAFRLYGPMARQPMSYFDTRLGRAQQIDAPALATKQTAIRADKPLRLAFSGRIDRMKGAQFVAPLVRALKAKGLAFTFELFGDGQLGSELGQIADGELHGHLIFNGPVPFDDALVPAMKARVDLFVCLHPQGDPACTYMETLGCGVPILSFANEAWVAMAQDQAFGATVPIGDVDAMASAIVALDADRERLAAMAGAAAAFAHAAPFEEVFERRTAHLRACAAMPQTI